MRRIRFSPGGGDLFQLACWTAELKNNRALIDHHSSRWRVNASTSSSWLLFTFHERQMRGRERERNTRHSFCRPRLSPAPAATWIHATTQIVFLLPMQQQLTPFYRLIKSNRSICLWTPPPSRCHHRRLFSRHFITSAIAMWTTGKGHFYSFFITQFWTWLWTWRQFEFLSFSNEIKNPAKKGIPTWNVMSIFTSEILVEVMPIRSIVRNNF